MLKTRRNLPKNYAMRSTNTDKAAKILIDIGSVIFRPNQPFRFDSGILSPVYVDNRLLISVPREREKIIRYLVGEIKKIGMPEVIAGCATAGIPHAAFIAQKLNLPMIYVRSKPKDHGRGNQVEGLLRRGQKVVVIEDTVSTGGSSRNVIEAIHAQGAKVIYILAIYTHGLDEAEKNFKESKVKFYYLCDLQTVAKVAVEKGFLKPEQVDVILGWSHDPKNWGRRMGYE